MFVQNKTKQKNNKATTYVWAEHPMLTFDADITPLSGAFSSKPINALSWVYFCAIFIQAIVHWFFPVPFCVNRFLIKLIEPHPSRSISWITMKPYPGPLRWATKAWVMWRNERVLRIRRHIHQVSPDLLTALPGVNPSGSLVREEVAKAFEERPTVRARVTLHNEERKTCSTNIIILSLFWAKLAEQI